MIHKPNKPALGWFFSLFIIIIIIVIVVGAGGRRDIIVVIIVCLWSDLSLLYTSIIDGIMIMIIIVI